MSHDKVVGFCEPNKCKVEVPTKEEYDAAVGKLDKITIDEDGNIVGNVTGNVTGDVTGNVTGNVTGFLFVSSTHSGTSGDYLYAEAEGLASTLVPYYEKNAIAVTIPDLEVLMPEFLRIEHGVYAKRADIKGNFDKTVTITVQNVGSSSFPIYYKESTSDGAYTGITIKYKSSITIELTAGLTYLVYTSVQGMNSIYISGTASSRYITYDTPE